MAKKWKNTDAAIAREKFKREIAVRLQRVATLNSIVVTAIRYGSFVGIAYFVKECVADLAGKETVAKFVMNGILKASADQWLAYIFGVGGITWGFLERKERRRTTERLGKRPGELEALIDPRRSSSKLHPKGTTGEADHI